MGGDGGGAAAEAKTAVDGGGDVTVHVRCSNGSKFSVQIGLESSVGSFKSALAQNCDVPAEQQRLIYKGRILKDDQTLDSYGTVLISFLMVIGFLYVDVGSFVFV